MIESDAYFNILSDDDDDDMINGGTITSTDAIRIKRNARKYRILSKCAMFVSLAISALVRRRPTMSAAGQRPWRRALNGLDETANERRMRRTLD
jgi:hypothetical protein